LVIWVIELQFEAQNGNNTAIFRTTKAEFLSLRAKRDWKVYLRQAAIP